MRVSFFGKQIKMLRKSPWNADLIIFPIFTDFTKNTWGIMNGYEATKAIRRSSHELAKTIPIIAMTANAFSEDIQHSLAAGMNAHISKPVDMKTLEKTIRSIKSGGGGVPKRRSLLSNH